MSLTAGICLYRYAAAYFQAVLPNQLQGKFIRCVAKVRGSQDVFISSWLSLLLMQNGTH